MNFGDWIGPYIFEKITGREHFKANPKGKSKETAFFVCGSILHQINKNDAAIIWGAGAISEDICFPKPKRVHAVRGPLSRAICLRQGYDCPKVYGDPGLLMPLFFCPRVPEPVWTLGIIPHFKDHDSLSDIYSDLPDVKIIDVRRPVEEVVRDIVTCQATISTSLHGLIISHTYGIPSAWGVASNKIVGGMFKYQDYFLGAQFNTVVDPIDLRQAWTKSDLVEIAKGAPKLPDAWSREKLLGACPFGDFISSKWGTN